MQADSGPIAGDRMIGIVLAAGDRLVIHINQIVHHGEAISADGVVIAPDTMEASVASNVDQHYLTRFILPAAAAFVSGPGPGVATTSNYDGGAISPFGGATTSTNLNFRSAARRRRRRRAAQQIGNTLNAAGAERADRLAGGQCRGRCDVPVERGRPALLTGRRSFASGRAMLRHRPFLCEVCHGHAYQSRPGSSTVTRSRSMCRCPTNSGPATQAIGGQAGGVMIRPSDGPIAGSGSAAVSE